LPADYVRWMLENGVFDKPDNLELKLALAKLGLLASG